MNNSTWGDASDPDGSSGHGPFEPYDPWAGRAPAPGPPATPEADALRTQVIPGVPAALLSHDADGGAWSGYGAGSTRAQHPEDGDEADPSDAAPHGRPGAEHGTGDHEAADDGGHTAYPPANDPGVRPDAERPGAEPFGRAGDSPVSGAPNAPKKSRAGRNLPAAIGVAVVLGGAIVGSLLTVPVLFVGIVLAAVLVGLWEFSDALGRSEKASGAVRLPLVPLAAGAIAMQIAAYERGPEGLVIAAALTALAVMVWRMTEGPEDYLRDVATGVFAAFYLPFLAAFAVLMLAADDGAKRVLAFMIVVVCSDTGAYAAGVALGRHKMAPTISPGKTWEGFAGAVVACALAGALCLTLLLDGTWWQGALLGAAVAATAAVGDLVESMIKRDLGVKDMGDLLPGHGGVMDRLDSLVAAAPVVWLLLELYL
ncbi:phosphatidate cytidylyltransferase [Yinghuangia sp. ASG 101]|uniref:phosphatidate cytidylyltransferase n=1 Tax=Yinghuangia sp. ASG 101 TaxID=2896848 RepID=UPI001E65D8BE|nr:phosphatidate cytidylyltransferase [Yinghuangia sp. ASG 101]UGQ09872.1 phosphatidate cytidylyltransferase [Yinghuangia sp. ASG 101]